ncbi:MAG TPA: hypothetical protein VG245_01830 [Candidatus Dormibacteraeota bacterium]|nr:hypothetical protein [Candidatus Dormibacteraeota bacterium]
MSRRAKLGLSRETVRELTAGGMGAAFGGVDTGTTTQAGYYGICRVLNSLVQEQGSCQPTCLCTPLD